MKSEVFVDITLQPQDLDRAARSLESVLPEGRFHGGRYEVRFRRSDPTLNELLVALDGLSIPYQVREERNFKAREIAEAVALHLEPTLRLGGAAGDAASAFQGGCPDCGRGAEQVGDLVIDDTTALGGFAITEEGRILVDETVARAMIEERVTGCILRPTRDPRGRVRDLFQVLPLNLLPPLCVPPTRIGKMPGATCERCGRGGLCVQSLLYYDLESDDLCDLNVCREASAGIAGAGSGVVVSQRLFRILCECEAMASSVEPIVLV